MLPFSIRALSVRPGSLGSTVLEVPAHGEESGTSIPISVLHGTSEGPVLALVAGIHGMEYAPIVALQRLRRAIDPQTLRGTILMVHVANMPSFLGRTIYYSPIDGKNLNRVFPGNPEGTVSDRIAYVLTHEIVARATHLVDLHGGDGNESLRPYSYWITTGPPAVAEIAREMAVAFALDRIVVDRDRPTDPDASMYLSNTALTRGKPAITTECGCLGEVSDEAIALIEHGVSGVLRLLGMREASGHLSIGASNHLKWVTQDAVIRAKSTGLFFPAVEREQTVRDGELLGRVTDFHGATLEDIHAPFDGEILYIVATPPVTEGEPLAMVGQLKDSINV